MTSQKNLSSIVRGVAQLPLLKKSFEQVKFVANEAIANPINVPALKDGGGGFTYEQPEKNYQYILACGTACQVTKEKKYAEFYEK